jgi:hypothetical protein
MTRRPIPLSRRRIDGIILVFFFINILVITYIVDLEQLVVPDPANFTYPVWPPAFMIDIIHNYGRTIDPVLIARPPWWRATIWIDVLFFGPFYIFAIYAYIKGKEWIRIPSIIYSSVLITNVTIILSEEIFGPHASPQLPIVLMLNAPWFLMPLLIIYRMWRSPHPFTEPVDAGATVTASRAVGSSQAAD